MIAKVIICIDFDANKKLEADEFLRRLVERTAKDVTNFMQSKDWNFSFKYDITKECQNQIISYVYGKCSQKGNLKKHDMEIIIDKANNEISKK